MDTILKHMDCTTMWKARRALSGQDFQRQRDKLQVGVCSPLHVLPKCRLELNKALALVHYNCCGGYEQTTHLWCRNKQTQGHQYGKDIVGSHGSTTAYCTSAAVSCARRTSNDPRQSQRHRSAASWESEG